MVTATVYPVYRSMEPRARPFVRIQCEVYANRIVSRRVSRVTCPRYNPLNNFPNIPNDPIQDLLRCSAGGWRTHHTQFTGREQKFTFYAIDDSTMMLNYSCKFIFTQCAEFLFRKAINKTMIRILTNSSSPSQNEENMKKYRRVRMGGRKRSGCSPGGWPSCRTC